jgi:hypothetical protein
MRGGGEVARSEDIKAEVMAALVSEGPSAVAAQFGIPIGTVKRWNQERQALMRPGEQQIVERIDPDRSAKKQRIADLVVDHLEANLEALQKLTRAIQDDDWLYKQSAGDVAILFGVVSDKTYRLLEAMVSAGER